jgi:uncharacterized membrane protein
MLKSFGEPVKIAILAFLGGVIGVFIISLFKKEYAASWVFSPLAAGLGGYVGGLIRQKKSDELRKQE